MKSGHIQQFTHLSEFTNLNEFNNTIKSFLQKHEQDFTKSERIAFKHLTRYSAKVPGVCNARIGKLVSACHKNGETISRSTFERMLSKAKKLGILTVHHTIRKEGGMAHNVFIFHRFDGAPSGKLTERSMTENPLEDKSQERKSPSETISFKANLKNKNHRPSHVTLEQLDYTYTPSNIPNEFIQAVKPFFRKAKDIHNLWQRVMIAYRRFQIAEPVDIYIQTIITAFKETVFRYKRGTIKTTFTQYFYGTIANLFAVEKRRETAATVLTYDWLNQ
ncbi:hypothetical protein [Bacillus taeanensis]|uniref:Helix-turn-helix domain-containing protein n=1 Tax=Bacillus taeanensis TaxID=273032 RepID=A0A366XTJ0_9BACI|nr:hypothetical protein [Bacillus taeanensis]RBW68858.1 hypothetical protein DS031_14055 [Bacillus taeanensis]